MVMFTCNRCSAALKKSQVESHSYQCGGPSKIDLTCHDCLKDFRGQEYESHTSCVTEEARYGGKGVVVKEAGKKQNQWCEVVQNVLANNDSLDPDVHKFLKSAVNLQNIPRKRPQFTNWAKNAMRCFDQKLIDKVFDVLIAEFSRLTVSEQPKSRTPVKDQSNKPEPKSESEIANGGEAGHKGANGDELNGNNKNNENPKQKKKKKNKKRAIDSATEGSQGGEKGESDTPKDTNGDGISGTSGNGEGKKKKKKHKMVSEDTVDTVDEAVAGDVSQNDENGEARKKNPKKKSADESVTETTVESSIATGDEPAGTAQPSAGAEQAEKQKLSKKQLKQLKKKAKFEAQVAEIESSKEVDEEKEVAEEENPKKSKKRKNGMEEEADGQKDDGTKKRKVEAMEVENEEPPEEEKSPKKVKFHWHETILTVLRKSKKDEVPVKKVAKRVIDEYVAQYGDNGIHEKLYAKMNKKLQTCPGVRVLKDKVKLIESDR